jgi:hypothetical protein
VASGSLLRGDVTKLGAISVQLGARMPEWIRRRKTTYTFADDSTIVQRVSVDLMLPDEEVFGDHPGPQEDEAIYVPLAVAEKRTFSGFSLVDRSGAVVSLLNTYEDATLAAAGFDALIEASAGATQTVRLRQDVRRMLIARDDADARDAMLAARRHGLDDVPLLKSGTQYRALLDDLLTGFMVMVPVKYKAGADHLFKLEFSSGFRWTGEGVGGRLRTVGASLGLFEKRLDFWWLDIGTAHSTHFEFVAPDDVRILKGRLLTGRPGLQPVTEPSQPRVDLHVAVEDPENPIASRADRATASISLAPRMSGPFLAITVLGWLTFLVLGAVSTRVAELDAQTVSAVVLVLPALLATYLVRQGEHVVTGRMLAGVRWIGLVIVGTSLAAAVLIGVGDLRTTPPTPAVTWRCERLEQTIGATPSPVVTPRREDCRITSAVSESGPQPTGVQGVLRAMTIVVLVLVLITTAGAFATWRRTKSALQMRDSAQIVG